MPSTVSEILAEHFVTLSLENIPAALIDDAKALTKPFSGTKVLKRHRDWDIA